MQEISQITRALKALAKELDVPVIALSQLSRAVEQRGGERPAAALGPARVGRDRAGRRRRDVRVPRGDATSRDDPALRGKAEIIIAKQRNGPTGDVTLTFLREFTKFVPYSPMMPGETEPGLLDAWPTMT